MEIRPTQMTRSQWERAIGPAALQHGWAYGAIAQRLGARVTRLEVPGGLAQVLARGIGPVSVGYLPLGVCWHEPVGDVAPVLSALRDRLGGALVAPSRTRAGLATLAGPREMAVWDLVPDPEALRAGLAKKWRNRLRAAERRGLPLRTEPGVPDWLLAAERAQGRRRGYRNLPPRWFGAWGQLSPGTMTTYIAGDPAMAAVTMARHGDGASYLIGWSDAAGRAASAVNLLLWRAASDLSLDGVGRLDLGQVDATRAPGLARFKRGTGARVETVPPLRLFGPGLRSR